MPTVGKLKKCHKEMDDFRYDAASDSLCCPSPNYCCPNSVSSCADPAAVRYSIDRTAATRDVILAHWPVHQNPPFRWEMDAQTTKFVADIWKDEAAQLGASHGLLFQRKAARLRAAAAEVERDLRMPARVERYKKPRFGIG